MEVLPIRWTYDTLHVTEPKHEEKDSLIILTETKLKRPSLSLL